MNPIVVIPARMRSTRLPGKMLADIAGKPLVAWVADRAKQSGADDVVIATDHQEIVDKVAALGWRVCTTSVAHETGTDRLAEAVTLLGLQDSEIVVNVQGDEPLIDPALICKVAAELALVYPPLLLFTFGLIVVGLGIFCPITGIRRLDGVGLLVRSGLPDAPLPLAGGHLDDHVRIGHLRLVLDAFPRPDLGKSDEQQNGGRHQGPE